MLSESKITFVERTLEKLNKGQVKLRRCQPALDTI